MDSNVPSTKCAQATSTSAGATRPPDVSSFAAEDARYSLERPAAETGDKIFWTLHFVVAILFSMELIARSFVQRGYLNSFFFWLDIIAVASMIFDFLPLFQTQDSVSCKHLFDAAQL